MNREMICAVVRDLLPSYIDRMTEEATNAFIDQHLTECAECRAVKKSMLQQTGPAEQAQAEFLERLRRARIRRRRRGWIIALSILLILCVCFLPQPRRVDMDVQAVRWRTGNALEGASPTRVRIFGTYFDFLFFDDRFDGDIMIEGVDISRRENALTQITFDPTGYLIYTDENWHLKSTGFIVAKPGMREFMIGLYDRRENNADGSGSGSWSGEDGTVITYPAQTREQAVEVTRRILDEQNCTWLSESVWEAGMDREEWERQNSL